MSAIKLKIKKNKGKHDLGVSKFFGKPTLPQKWNDFNDTTIFFLQINLEEIKNFDKDNKLPHEGYLYFFLDVEDEYAVTCDVRYFKGIPDAVVDDFNSIVPGYEQYDKEVLVEFEECEDDEMGTKLLGYPADWNYMDEPRKLLLQFDPLDAGLGLFEQIDGLFYFFFDEKDENDFSKVTLQEEYS